MVLPSEKFFTATITDRRDLSDDLWVIRVDPGGPFQFTAGQYATLGVPARAAPGRAGVFHRLVAL